MGGRARRDKFQNLMIRKNTGFAGARGKPKPLPGADRSYLSVRQNVTRAPARAPDPSRDPEPSKTTLRRASYARSGRGARDRKLAAKPQLPHARPTYLRKHVQPSFHLRDGRADRSAAAAPSTHQREAQAAAAHLQQQRQLARCAQVGQRRMEGTDARARDLRHLGVPWERARQIWCGGAAARPLRPRRAFPCRYGSKLPRFLRAWVARERRSRR